MNEQLATKTIDIVASVTGRTPEVLRTDATFDELGIDSLDRLNILFELESAFDIDIPDEEARGIQTVKQIVERVEAYVQRAQGEGA